MEEIKVIKVFNLLDTKGNKLQLRLGVMKNFNYVPEKGDEGLRWSFMGTKIPMPVRSGTWFNGFPTYIMLDWLKRNGWCVHTMVVTDNNRVLVYDLPNGNEEGTYVLSEVAIEQGKNAFEGAIRMLCDNGYVLKAVSLYRYVNPCSLKDAKYAVDEIRHAK